jgi:hypothetical protein
VKVHNREPTARVTVSKSHRFFSFLLEPTPTHS